MNDVVEVGGPETFRIDELLRRDMLARDDTREVVADPEAPYSGARVEDRTLVPFTGAALGSIRYEEWTAVR